MPKTEYNFSLFPSVPFLYTNVFPYINEKSSQNALSTINQRGKLNLLTPALHIPRREVLTGLFAVPWYAGEAASLASTSRKYMQNI